VSSRAEAPGGAGRRRWAVLAAGMVAMMAGCAFQFGLPFLIPALRDEGLTLTEAGLLASAPVAGLLATLVAWGVAADRWGERRVLAIGLTGQGVILAASAAAPVGALAVCFFLAGASGAAVNASSGRLVLGWFAARERGLAMGLRQTALPLGVGLAALLLPVLPRQTALNFLGAFALMAAVLTAAVVRDTAISPRQVTESRSTRTLWRIHGASALLVVPQVTVGTFALVFLVDAHGWAPGVAGRALALGQVGGGVARLVAGWWSDRLGERLRPVRWIALGIAAIVALLAAGAHPAVLLAAAVLTVSPNGLAYTAVAEQAGPARAGKALGIQNTAQNLAGMATAPLMAGLIAATSYRTAFAAAAIFPLAAALVIPARR
jgi:MFS family permease